MGELILFTGGALFLGLAIETLKILDRWKNEWIPTQGTVVGILEHPSKEFSSILTFSHKGLKFWYQTQKLARPSPYTQAGTTCLIFVSPDLPPYILTPEFHILPRIFLGIGVLQVVLGSLLLAPHGEIRVLSYLGLLLVGMFLLLSKFGSHLEKLFKKLKLFSNTAFEIEEQSFPRNLLNTTEFRSKIKYSMAISRLVGLAVIFFSLFLGSMIFEKRSFLLKQPKGALGTVLEIKSYKTERIGGRSYWRYNPVIAFRDAQTGREFQFEERAYMLRPYPKVGQQLWVLYNPHNPHLSTIDQGILNWFWFILVVGFFPLFILIGFALLIRGRILGLRKWKKRFFRLWKRY